MLEDELNIWILEAKLNGKSGRIFSGIRAYYIYVETDEEVIDMLSRVASSNNLQLRVSDHDEELMVWFCQADSAEESGYASTFR